MKSKLHQIKTEDINKNLPNLKEAKESKAVVIGKWLMNTIENNGKIKPNFLLPTKPDLAYMLGVSIGTIQNSLRYIEDLGYVESKQCIGTIVRDRSCAVDKFRKLTSKREIAIEAIKRYISDKNYKIGDILPSSRVISNLIDFSQNTTRLAMETLVAQKVLEHDLENNFVVKSVDFDVVEISADKNETLVKKIENDLKNYITSNLAVGDRLPAHEQLSNELSVSIKTIHDALKTLIAEGILLPRRGRYGTTVLKMPGDKNVSVKPETSIFASAPEAAFYHYEKTQNYIKKIIAENFEVGSKLPSILELSKQLDLSPNTIRKAFKNLAEDGYLTFSRGRYGGTFVVEIPDEQGFKWLAVSPSYTKVYEN